MSNLLLNYIVEKNHHKFRRDCDIVLAESFSKEKLEPAERMTVRFEKMMEAETPVILDNEKI